MRLDTLRDAIDRVILHEDESSATFDSCMADGEGFIRAVACVSWETLHQVWLPYTDKKVTGGEKASTHMICPLYAKR